MERGDKDDRGRRQNGGSEREREREKGGK